MGYREQSPFRERQQDNLRRQVKERVGGLLVEREGKPHLPTAEALLWVATELLASAARRSGQDPSETFETLADSFELTLQGHLNAQGKEMRDFKGCRTQKNIRNWKGWM